MLEASWMRWQQFQGTKSKIYIELIGDTGIPVTFLQGALTCSEVEMATMAPIPLMTVAPLPVVTMAPLPEARHLVTPLLEMLVHQAREDFKGVSLEEWQDMKGQSKIATKVIPKSTRDISSSFILFASLCILLILKMTLLTLTMCKSPCNPIEDWMTCFEGLEGTSCCKTLGWKTQICYDLLGLSTPTVVVAEVEVATVAPLPVATMAPLPEAGCRHCNGRNHVAYGNLWASFVLDFGPDSGATLSFNNNKMH